MHTRREGILCGTMARGIFDMNIGQQYCSETGMLHDSLKGKYSSLHQSE